MTPELRGRLAVKPAEAAGALGVSRWTIDRAIADGRLPSFKVGEVRLINVAALKAFARGKGAT